MTELTLVGLHEEGEHVVLEGPDGQHFRVRIDEALRAAVRRNRPQLEQARAQLTANVPPREIQARIRAGATAEEVAEQTGMPVELVRRYDGPVVAERQYVAEQARGARIGHESSAPVLGDLVTDRLATRDVAPSSITWDAYRRAAAPWTVEVHFQAAGAPRSARWTYDAANRRVKALDDEARWLSETELPDEPIPRSRHLTAVRDRVFDIEVDAALRPLLAQVDLPATAGPEETEEPADDTQSLLDDLADRRGVRQELEPEAEDEQFSGFGPQHAFDFDSSDAGPASAPAAHPPAARSEQPDDARVLKMPAARSEQSAHPARSEQSAHPAQGEAHGPAPRTDSGHVPRDGPTARPRGRKPRASVPSWDEIVFGARHE
jgi:hypothetical protein